MKILNQIKDSTAIKQLWKIGRIVLHDTETGEILKVVLANDTRNRRIGIIDVETEINANVTQKNWLK